MELAKKVAKLLTQNKVVAIARGRAEFGPRALGNRFILISAIDENNQSTLKLKVKKRESFRPFAPIVLESDAKEYFEMKKTSPYMIKTYYVKVVHRLLPPEIVENMYSRIHQKRSCIPAVTHVDYSVCVQTVSSKQTVFIENC